MGIKLNAKFENNKSIFNFCLLKHLSDLLTPNVKLQIKLLNIKVLNKN